MFVYRPYRGSLEESLKHKKIFSTKEEMFDYIVKEWEGLICKEDLYIGEILGDDYRIGWKNCRYVLTKRCGNEHYAIPQAIGHCFEKWE